MVNDAFVSVVNGYKKAVETENKASAELERALNQDLSAHTISVQSQKLLALSELTTLEARKIAYYAMCDDEIPSLNAGIEADNMFTKARITVEHNEIRIILPCLLPRRSYNKKDSGYFTEMLEETIKQRQIPVFEERVVVYFEQIFDEQTPIRKVCDCDNAEINSVINVLVGLLIRDDGPLSCSYMVSAHRGEATETIVHIVRERDFPTLLASICVA